jgi:hypothetical protein
MMRSLRYAGAVGLMVLGAVPLTPQQTGEQSAGPVIRVTVDLVQVDAVVTDANGRHVTGLKPEDFEILEDGAGKMAPRQARMSICAAACKRLWMGTAAIMTFCGGPAEGARLPGDLPGRCPDLR